MELIEFCRRWKRVLENFSCRKIFLLLFVLLCILLYLGPDILNRIFHKDMIEKDLSEESLESELHDLYLDAEVFDANIQHTPIKQPEKLFKPFVGNGLLGIVIDPTSPLYIKSSRTLSIPLPYHPILTLSYNLNSNIATVINYLNGIGFRYQCFSNGVCAKFSYYANRHLPNIFIQEIEIKNPTLEVIHLQLNQLTSNWHPSHILQLKPTEVVYGKTREYEVISGVVNNQNHLTTNPIMVVIITEKLDKSVEVRAKDKKYLQVLTSVCYTETTNEEFYTFEKKNLEETCIQRMKEATIKDPSDLRKNHVNVWKQLWSTGISISFSKADLALNGHQINATMYHVLSNVRSFYHEEATTAAMRSDLSYKLSYSEGCYGGYHHTYQAVNLWGDMSTLDNINTVVSYWLLTLEKQGCHKLVSAGASGVVQAMVLSFGGFRFSNQHLEFNMHPKFFHRDFSFRRINYGNATHVNISVELQEDNKAVIYVALDRSDRNYYACDGGCLDEPVELGPTKAMFPVKLTDPVTSVLYITSDKQHMELLKHTIHVKEVVEAPAQEHNVIALHRHGHHLGGLPALFWVSVSFLIIVFHLFLFKLIYNEYCGHQEKYRTYRYRKM
uniref:Uncharacterized protein n=1 Tax=Clastoptera arizonana TaxID=38151 RepID=A0A1B6CR64_9HEMI